MTQSLWDKDPKRRITMAKAKQTLDDAQTILRLESLVRSREAPFFALPDQAAGVELLGLLSEWATTLTRATSARASSVVDARKMTVAVCDTLNKLQPHSHDEQLANALDDLTAALRNISSWDRAEESRLRAAQLHRDLGSHDTVYAYIFFNSLHTLTTAA